MPTKRLFLFAGYDANGVVDTALLHYIRTLAIMGDIIVYMDCDCDDAELKKLAPYVLHAGATRHGEYDFGSYKRAYIYARDAKILQNYDVVYMVNDSVYGPMCDLGPILANLESQNLDAFGLVRNPHKTHPHIQSWFIGMRPAVFLSEWFNEFICAVKKLAKKTHVTYEYEHGFSARLNVHGHKWGCMISAPKRSIYNAPRQLYKLGLPFIKKATFTRHNGTYGRQINYILGRAPAPTRDAILTSARRTMGDKYIKWLLTRNPIKIAYRGIRQGINKIFNGGL